MEYDYIVVGAGSSGCAVAEGLSRNGKFSVLLVEAGGRNRSPLVGMPRGWVKLWEDPRYFWSFPIDAQDGRPTGEKWAYGKGLGGSSAVNGTMYFRGQACDYEQWARYGSAEWSWDVMKRVFKEIEDFHGTAPDASRGRGGPVEITELVDRSPLSRAVISAAEAQGIPFLADVNGENRLGIGFTQATVDRRGKRVSSYAAFLKKGPRRKNLQIVPKVLVERILFEGIRATAVECLKGKETLTYRARKEIVICSGVMNSPKLLQISGIGPAETLFRLGVKIVANLPAVGENLSEHVMLPFAYRLKKGAGLNREFRGWRLGGNLARYMMSGTGVMSFAATELNAFVSVDGDRTWPNVQFAISPYSFSAGAGEEPGRGVPENLPGITLTAMYVRPYSFGRVAARSRDAAVSPRVEANWLSDSRDSSNVVAMVRSAHAFMKHSELREYVGSPLSLDPEEMSDDQVLRYAKSNLSSGLHGTGTCRIGPRESAVVDARLRVHGVQSLRIADCSIMPTPISGNTNGPAMAVGYRAAELMLEDA